MNQPCWCGNTNLREFSPEYWCCEVCSTLVSKSFPTADVAEVRDEDQDFYGKKYWLGHQVEELGLTSIVERSRSDLLDRCTSWLETVLDFSSPPARMLELGCSHGGFLALAQLAGFHTTGVELSPWVVDFARDNFGVDVRIGPIEQQKFPIGSFDVVCMFDVLEHLQDPIMSLKLCARVLARNGILVIQTPQYPARTDFAELQRTGHPFLQMMLPDEHLFLFSNDSVKMLLSRVGLISCEFASAPFAHYDMMLVAGKDLLVRTSSQAQSEALEKTGGGRIIQAFLQVSRKAVKLDSHRQYLQAHFIRAQEDIEKLSQEKQELQANFVQAKQSMASLQDQLTAAHIENERLSKEDYYTRKWLRQTYAERNELRRWAGIRAAVNEWSKRLVSVVGKRIPNRLTKPRRQPVRVCVDLTALLAKGKNSELALAIMNLLKRLSQDERFEFIYVGLEDSSAEVDALLRRQDALILISLDPRKARHRPSQVEIIQTLKVANLRRHQTDIFYAPFGEVSAVARSFKTVCFVPDLPHHDFSGLVSPDQLDSCELSMANTLSTATKVQLGSEYMRQRLIEAYPIWPGNTLVTYLRMDGSIITERSAQSRARPFFICPKGYYSRKSSEALLAGYKSYLTFAGETWWGLVLAGCEEDRHNDLRDLVHSLELDDHVEFEDYLRGETFRSLLQTASALVYPTLHEGSGIPIFEAFRFSVPVVCSSLCSLPEVAGDAALYVNPYTPGEITHALLAVASSEETRSRLISLGRQQLNKFSPEDETKKLADAFLDLAEAR